MFLCFAHICRQANEVAHRIARFALHIGSNISRFEEPPDFICDLL